MHECDGVVPWQSLGGDDAFDRGDTPDNGNALIVDGSKRFGLNAVASFRVQSLRQGAQLAELLELLRRQKGWSRAHIGLLVGRQVPLGGEWEPKFADEAAGLRYRDLNGDKWVQLKEGVLRLLQGNAGHV